MAEKHEDLNAQLGKLSPLARERVERALKETLEKELAELAGRPGGLGPIACFSRGILFSKSGSQSLDEVVLPELAEMDEAKFRTFMDRIALLKGSKPGGGAPGA